MARDDGAGLVIRGSYYLSGDSVLFQAGIMDVASGRMLRSFDPVGAPVDRATAALEALRERIAAGLGALVNASPRLTRRSRSEYAAEPPRLPRVRGGAQGRVTGKLMPGTTAGQPRLDSTFVAPLIQLASGARGTTSARSRTRSAPCSITAADQLTPWNRITIDLMRARCRGDMAKGLSLSSSGIERILDCCRRAQYASALQSSNQPRAAREILRGFDPEHDLVGGVRGGCVA